jgi:hypothetical protein
MKHSKAYFKVKMHLDEVIKTMLVPQHGMLTANKHIIRNVIPHFICRIGPDLYRALRCTKVSTCVETAQFIKLN